MRIFLVISILFASTSLFANQHADCLDRIYVKHHVSIERAQETLRSETEECLRYPVGDSYYSCQDKAQRKYQKAVDRADAVLKQEHKSCMKYPWI